MTEELMKPTAPDSRHLASRVLAAYLRHNMMPTGDVPKALREIYRAFEVLAVLGATAARAKPAVPVKRSVTRNYLICLEDGRTLKMLKRYLRTKYGMSPEDYRTKWDLSASYPMVAPSYAMERSAIAKKSGLGRKPAGRQKKRKK